jgi:hypothetical protein
MNRTTRARKEVELKTLKKLGRRTSGFKARKCDYPKNTTRTDLAGTYGYSDTGRYIGKPWGQCY